MEQAAVMMGWFTIALLATATVLYSYQFLMKRPKLAWWARFFAGASFIALTAAIGLRSVATDGTELNGHNQLVLVAWALLAVYLVVEHLIKVKVYGTFLVPVSFVLLIIAQFLTGAAPQDLTAEQLNQLDSWRITFHVGLIVFANAGYFIGSAASALYLVLDRQLKTHSTGGFFRRLPSLKQTQTLARRAIVFAFPAYSAGMVLGVIRAIETDVQGWWADPRIMLSGLVWVSYAAYLFLVYRHGASARTTSWVAILGLFLVTATAIAARTLPAGFHIFGIGG